MHTSDYYYDVVRQNLIKYREKAGLTQKQLANKAGYEENTLGKIESPSTKWGFSLEFVGRMADTLGIDIRCLFEPLE